MCTKAAEEEYQSMFEKLGIRGIEDLGNNEGLYQEFSFQDLLSKAEFMKVKGNDLFKKDDCEGAKAFYTEGLDILKVASNYVDETDEYCIRQYRLQLIKAALLGNRGFMYLKIHRYFDAIRDFSYCIFWSSKPNYVMKLPSHQSFRLTGFTTLETKACYRRSLAFREIGNNNQALMDITDILGMLGTEGLRQGVPDSIREAAMQDLRILSGTDPESKMTKPTYKQDKRLVDMGANWEKIEIKNRISGRQGHSAAYWGGCIFVVGGQDHWHRFKADFHVLDLTEKVWKCLTAPREAKVRYGHTAVIYKDQMFIYGGSSAKNVYKGTCWKFDFKTQEWSKWNSRSFRNSNSPCVLEHSACMLGNLMYIFGGRGKIGERAIEHSCNLYSLDLNKHGVCKKLSGYDDSNPLELGYNSPEPRYNHVSWADAPRERIYIFGGSLYRESISCAKHKHTKKMNLNVYEQSGYELNNHTLQDLFYYDISTEQWTKTELCGNFPAPRCELGCIATTQGALLFGGFTGALKTVDWEPEGVAEQCYLSRYLGDTFHFMRNTDSFCMIADYGISSRAKSTLVSDGKDKIYAVHGYRGSQNTKPIAPGTIYDDIYVIDLSRCDPKLESDTVRLCAFCGVSANEEKLRKCAGKCGGKVHYCSKQCQRVDWKKHKPDCV